MKYEVDSCVCDSCIKNEKDEIVLIVNSRANALTISEILNFDENHENGILAPKVWESQKIKETARAILQELYDEAMRYSNEVVELTAFEIKQLAKEKGIELERNL